MLKIIDVDYLENYKLQLIFDNDKILDVDLESELTGELFSPLKDLSLFTQYGLINGTIEWINGADFSLEYLFEIGKVNKIAV